MASGEMIAIIDYGMGNLQSVSKALKHLGAQTCVTGNPAQVEQADKVILPGVGAFGAAMAELRRLNLVEPIMSAMKKDKPYLGICLGLQLLFEKSEESPGVTGFGIFKGIVTRFSNSSLATEHSSLKIPHMGWNQIYSVQRRASSVPADDRLLKGIPEGSFFYFVHSYYANPADRSLVASESEYGLRFPAMIARERLFATQFHPEKSQTVGLRLLKNFIELA